MDQVARHRAEGRESLQSLYALIEEPLARVESLLRQSLHSEHPFVDRLAQYGFNLGGKRLRPALVLLSGLVSGGLRPEHEVLGAIVEMIHTASLIHDDVLDEASLRRHLKTVNARWDNEASILLGDYLFARAIAMASRIDGGQACRLICEASEAMCEGELRQVERRGRFDLTENEYTEIIAGKTAALIACCCRLGAIHAGASPEIQQSLHRFGYKIGVAFQIVDDLLDVQGDERITGKSLGTDLVKQKPTLPLIRLLEQVNSQERADLLRILNNSQNHRGELLRPWFDRSDALAYARSRALALTEEAAAELQALPPSPACDVLQAICRFVVGRRQ